MSEQLIRKPRSEPTPGDDETHFLSSDGDDPNAAGYAQIAKAVDAVLERRWGDRVLQRPALEASGQGLSSVGTREDREEVAKVRLKELAGDPCLPGHDRDRHRSDSGRGVGIDAARNPARIDIELHRPDHTLTGQRLGEGAHREVMAPRPDQVSAGVTPSATGPPPAAHAAGPPSTP